jgi:hypothetical protein
LFEHDLFGKPVSTFPDHALEESSNKAAPPGIRTRRQRMEFSRYLAFLVIVVVLFVVFFLAIARS